MVTVLVYDKWNNKTSFTVDTIRQGREYAKRIITEGLWYMEEDGMNNKEVFVPSCHVIKVKVINEE